MDGSEAKKITFIMTEVHIIATLRPVVGKENQLRDRLFRTAGKVTREEPDCLTFLLTETRDPREGVVFKVIERWTSQEALTRHHDRDWLQEMYRAFEDE
ncbi:hypothetical protein P168DRAFT_292948 [Aspergillus campestris IBT 28561]|uniref:ABM domain-containing protein n=1 Tax=Aspergillus campestris (strain IBT 28561) TaxID=1392248 RepID=A0A2I1CTW0_ASPC2|nr:uncharacterized protein P168DRAFT_292948 [Aspergillus campestris IBT 28561]PKY01051.1 hypothetical protein P168DRAFT_292948 [Aspergillus campestris IBT 28561]